MSAFDCYLPTLARQLGFEPPTTDADRREFWTTFSQQLIYRREPDGETPFRIEKWKQAQSTTANKEMERANESQDSKAQETRDKDDSKGDPSPEAWALWLYGSIALLLYCSIAYIGGRLRGNAHDPQAAMPHAGTRVTGRCAFCETLVSPRRSIRRLGRASCATGLSMQQSRLRHLRNGTATRSATI
jgi:hypothetical protein